MSFYKIFKTVLITLILLQIAPSLIRGIRRQYSALLETRTSVAVMPISGTISDSCYYTTQLETLFKDTDIKALLLKIDCSECSAGTSEIIFREIQSLKQEYSKPVIALIENQCSSGGYLIACAADTLIAPGSSLIGPFGANPSFCNNAAAPSSERAQEIAADLFNQYAATIATARKQALTKMGDIIPSTVLTGLQAKQRGLIDDIGGLQTAIRTIKAKALIDGEIEWVYPPAPGGFWGALLGASNGQNTLITQWVHALQTHTN